MCAVSAITDHFRDRWPVPIDYWTQPAMPSIVPSIHITLEQYHEYQALKKKMEQYDSATGQPHCEKPEVTDWEKSLEKVLKEKYNISPC